MLDVDQDLDPRQVPRQGTQIAPSRPWRPRGIAAPGSGPLRGLGCGRGLLEVLKSKLQLVGVEPLRAPAELSALQLPDQKPQLIDLSLGRVTLLANQVALSASGIQLGQNSIALDLKSSASRALGGNNFSHMLQLLQQPMGVSWKIILRQRHAAILLTRRPGSQDFRSPSRARARDRAGL